MTFMKKIMDLFNMDNWKEHKSGVTLSNYVSYLPNTKNVISLQKIRYYWNAHPQNYQRNFRESSIREYEIYGKTLLLWLFEKASPLKTNFPVYFERECHISNPSKMQSQLLQDAYIVPAPLLDILSSYKMQDLKIIADSIGCVKKGKKEELIERIYQNLDENITRTLISGSNLFILSNKGRTFLNDNYDYVELHRHWNYNLSLYDFNRNRFCGNCKRSFEDNAYTLIRQRIFSNCSHCYYHMMEYDYYSLYSIALSGHKIDIALDCYLRYLYLISCCIRTAQYYATGFYHSDYNPQDEIIFTSRNAACIAELSYFYDRSYVENIYEDKSLPPSFLTKDEMANMIDNIIANAAFDYTKYNELIISRLRKYSRA